MVAFGLSLIHCDGTMDLVGLVRVVQANTLSLVQGGITAGSTTFEASCEAVRICCSILVERLKALKENLLHKTGSVDWKTLIYQTEVQAVNLSASTYYTPDSAFQQYLNYGAAVSEIEGAFVQEIGFFMTEEYLTDTNGMVIADSTWTYKIPTIDTIPKQLNVEILSSGHHRIYVLSSKASGEPPMLLAATVHCATRAAIKEARKQARSGGASDSPDIFQVIVPATMSVVKELCGLDIVDKYLQQTRED